MSDTLESKKTPLMKLYEEETGKLSIWKGKLSKDFLNWKKKIEKKDLKRKDKDTSRAKVIV